MFKVHKSKSHKNESWKRFKSEIAGYDPDRDDAQEKTSHADDMWEFEEANEEVSENDILNFGKQLEHNLASLLLTMQTVQEILCKRFYSNFVKLRSWQSHFCTAKWGPH